MAFNHITKAVSSGKPGSITECLTPTCSCGWVGIGYEAHNDWQYTLVEEQIEEHLAKVKKEELAHDV